MAIGANLYNQESMAHAFLFLSRQEESHFLHIFHYRSFIPGIVQKLIFHHFESIFTIYLLSLMNSILDVSLALTKGEVSL